MVYCSPEEGKATKKPTEPGSKAYKAKMNYTKLRNKKEAGKHLTSSCDPLGARTRDPNIKSVVLYQLS